MARVMFVNLPVSDLGRARWFFGRLGFSFDPRFTDEKAACMVVSDLGYVMLIQEAFYRTFTRRELCDTSRQNESLVAFSGASRDEVDALVRAAEAAGGALAMAPVDHGFMYERSFYDPDGHHWAVVWMDPRVASGDAAPAGAGAAAARSTSGRGPAAEGPLAGAAGVGELDAEARRPAHEPGGGGLRVERVQAVDSSRTAREKGKV